MGADRSISKQGRVPPSSSFRYERGKLMAEGVPFERIAQEHGTPCYVYSEGAITSAYQRIDSSLGGPTGMPHTVFYAMKANSNLSVLRLLKRLGAGVDIVSGGELARALHAGFTPDRIVYSGVGKTDAELRAALQADVRAIHAESAQEIDAIESIAKSLGRVARIALRVNPDVDAGTHPYIATGLRSSKFGIALDVAAALLPRLTSSPQLRLEGLACHIGSMVESPKPIAEAVEIVARFARECQRKGAPITTLDAGGGWPIAYGDEASDPAPFSDFGQMIVEAVRAGYGDGDDANGTPLALAVEPGRSIVGDAGALLTRVVFVKEQAGKRFIIVDAAMTELIRPALYGSFHAIVPVHEPSPNAATALADVVGPVCESGDFFAIDRALPDLKRGDLVVLRGAGAYAAAMASTYNARPLAAEVMVHHEQTTVVRRRQRVEALWQDEEG